MNKNNEEMTDKQIIIDGVDTGGCECIIEDYQRANNFEGRYEHIKNVCELGERGAEYYNLFCKDNPNCYYKQLKRKEQECKDLREDIKDIANLLDLDIGEEYNFGNIELEIKQLKAKEQECEKLKEQLQKYRSTFEEIREDMEQDTTCESRECACDDYAECINCIKETILNKISEGLKEETQYCPMCEEWAEKYDQLKAENETLFKAIEEVNKINKKLKAENEKQKEFRKLLEEQMEFNRNELELALSSEIKRSDFLLKEFQKVDKQKDNWREQAEKYSQTLTEIKEIAESCGWNFGSEILYKRIEQILQKINEVENG